MAHENTTAHSSPMLDEGQHALSPAVGQLRGGTLFLLAYYAFFLVSKLVGFMPGYSLDDYAIVRAAGDNSLAGFFISQGRYGSALMDVILHACNLTMSSFSTIGLAATAVFSGLFFRDALDLPPKGTATIAIGLGALLGAHPYYTEYVSYRQAALPMSLTFLGMWLALRLYRGALGAGTVRVSHLIASVLVATLVMGFNQLAVCFLSIAVLCVHVRRLQHGLPPGLGLGFLRRQGWLAPPVHATVAGIVLILCNMLVAKLVLVTAGVPATGRSELIPVELLTQRWTELTHLVTVLWAQSETVAAWPAKALAAAGFIVLLVARLGTAKGSAWLAVVVLIAATVAALIPIAVTVTWWPVPRTLIAVPFALASAVSVLIPTSNPRVTLAGILLITSGCIFSAHSQSILFNQQRLNRWDQMQAREMALLATEKYPEAASKLAIVGPTWSHEIAQSIAQGDMNISALGVDWALDPLFDEATGRDQNVRLAPEFSGLCSTSAKYPAPSSLHKQGDEVVICMH